MKNFIFNGLLIWIVAGWWWWLVFLLPWSWYSIVRWNVDENSVRRFTLLQPKFIVAFKVCCIGMPRTTLRVTGGNNRESLGRWVHLTHLVSLLWWDRDINLNTDVMCVAYCNSTLLCLSCLILVLMQVKICCSGVCRQDHSME